MLKWWVSRKIHIEIFEESRHSIASFSHLKLEKISLFKKWQKFFEVTKLNNETQNEKTNIKIKIRRRSLTKRIIKINIKKSEHKK